LQFIDQKNIFCKCNFTKTLVIKTPNLYPDPP
jgi:hypothetical protein